VTHEKKSFNYLSGIKKLKKILFLNPYFIQDSFKKDKNFLIEKFSVTSSFGFVIT